MRFSVLQKSLLLCACLAYIGFLVFFLLENGWGILACGVLPGIFFLTVLYVGAAPEGEEASEDGEEREPRMNVDSLIDQVSEQRQRAERSEQELSVAAKRIRELEGEADKLSGERAELAEQLDEARRQLEELEQAVASGQSVGAPEDGDAAHRSTGGSPEARTEESGDSGIPGTTWGSAQVYESSLLPLEAGDAPERIDLAEAVEAAVRRMHSQTRKAGICVKTVGAKEEVYLQANRRMVEILFRNIIDNAVKYMKREGILQITFSGMAGEVFVVCKDNGEGLPVQETDHIFELNYQGSNRVSGNGLGLAQARAIVEYCGGSIYARSTRDGGMGIYIHLPSGIREAGE